MARMTRKRWANLLSWWKATEFPQGTMNQPTLWLKPTLLVQTSPSTPSPIADRAAGLSERASILVDRKTGDLGAAQCGGASLDIVKLS